MAHRRTPFLLVCPPKAKVEPEGAGLCRVAVADMAVGRYHAETRAWVIHGN